MDGLSTHMAIRDELIKVKPDVVTNTEDYIINNNSYPDDLFEIICDALKGNEELLDLFKNHIGYDDHNQLYEFIFMPQNSNEENFYIAEEEEEEADGFYEDPISSENPPFLISSSLESIDIHKSKDEPEEPKVQKKNPTLDNVINIDEYQKQQNDIVEQISRLFSISFAAANLLLKKFEWDINLLIKQAGSKNEEIKGWLDKQGSIKTTNIGKGLCCICFEEDVDLYRHYCGHAICYECFKREIESQLEECEYPIVCRIEGCGSEIMQDDIETFCGKTVSQNYQRKYIEHQMFLNKELIKCPAEGCNYSIKRNSYNLCKIGKCICGKKICLKCRQDSHAPLTCEQVDKWNQIQEYFTKLEEDQKKWEFKELTLWRYRQRNMQEIVDVYKEFGRQLSEEIEEENKREIEEINEIKKQIQQETNKDIITHLESKLVDKELAHETKMQMRDNMNEDFLFESTNYPETLAHNAKTYFKYFNEWKKSKLENRRRKKANSNSDKTQIKYEKAMVKKCPNCQATIVKDGGCNQMVCHSCKYQFCWVCLENWSTHKNYFRCIHEKEDSNSNNNDNSNSNNNDQNELPQFVLIPKKVRVRSRRRRRLPDSQLQYRPLLGRFLRIFLGNVDDDGDSRADRFDNDYNAINMADRMHEIGDDIEYDDEYDDGKKENEEEEENLSDIDHTFTISPLNPKKHCLLFPLE